MRKKTDLFFAPAVKDRKQELPLDFAVKMLDALIAYNKTLMSQVIVGSPQDVVELMLSSLVKLSEIPSCITIPENIKIKELKKYYIDNIIDDIKAYERIKLKLNEGTSLDDVYLNFFILYTQAVGELKVNSPKSKIEGLLSQFFSPEYAKNKSKEIVTNINARNNKCPVLAEYNTLAKVLKVLKPHLSPNCLRCVNGVEMYFLNSATGVILSSDESKKIDRNIKKYRSNNWANPMLQELIQNYCKFQNTELLGISTSTSVPDNFINLYAKLNELCTMEMQIDTLIRVEKAQAKSAEMIKSLAQHSAKEEKVSPAMIRKKETNLPKNKLKIETAPQLIPADALVENESLSLLAIEPVIAEPVIDLIEIAEVSQMIATELLEAAKVEEGEQIQDEPNYIYQPFYKIAEKQVQRAQSNVLHLKEDDKLTFLQVFGLKPYDSINLRALVNLTLNFGGVIKTTGANRCRIEIKNIYAFVTVPQEDLKKACNSATITMHGGGHRSTRSQNHDREKAPPYLIAQFRDAFVRAGFTPLNLGLELESVNPNNPV